MAAPCCRPIRTSMTSNMTQTMSRQIRVTLSSLKSPATSWAYCRSDPTRCRRQQEKMHSCGTWGGGLIPTMSHIREIGCPSLVHAPQNVDIPSSGRLRMSFAPDSNAFVGAVTPRQSTTQMSATARTLKPFCSRAFCRISFARSRGFCAEFSLLRSCGHSLFSAKVSTRSCCWCCLVLSMVGV